jgi:hypothetical protein
MDINIVGFLSNIIYIYMDLKNNNVISYSHAHIFIYKNKNYTFESSGIKIIEVNQNMLSF